MKIIEFEYQNTPKSEEPIALCLGYFDAIHLGHQAIINHAKQSGYKVAVMSFDNPPVYVLKKREDNLGLTSNADKAEYFSELGVDYFYILHFDENVANLSRYEFIDLVLNKIAPKMIFCGDDYTFGKDAQGTVNYLKQYFDVSSLSLMMNDDHKISSREITGMLRRKEITKANLLLGRNYRVCGIVKRGNHLGKELGFPTANLDLDFPYILPGQGVYMGYATYEDIKYKAIISIGTHPTVMQLDKPIIEVHIIDFNKDVYNELLFVEFYSYIRDNIRFPSLEELKEQLKKDLQKAKKTLQ